MAKSTKKKENNNYWGYVIFAALILLYIPFADTIWKPSESNDNTITSHFKATSKRNSPNTNNSTNYCELSVTEVVRQISSETNYRLNSNGSVNFTERFDRASNRWVEHQIRITGNGKRLEGDWRMVSGNRIIITNLQVTSGNFDASNNSKTTGTLTLRCNGDLDGEFRDPNRNKREINIKKSR